MFGSTQLITSSYDNKRLKGELPNRCYYNNLGSVYEYVEEKNDGWKSFEDTRNGRKRRKRINRDKIVNSFMQNTSLNKYQAWKLLRFNNWNENEAYSNYNRINRNNQEIDEFISEVLDIELNQNQKED